MLSGCCKETVEALTELALLFDAWFILIMRSDPNPNEICSIFNGQGPVMRFNSHGPELANLFEVQRRVCGIFFQEVEVVSGNFLDWKEGAHSKTKIEQLCDVSQVLESTLCFFFQRLAHQKIELSGLRVGFDLLVPPLPALF